MRKSLIGLLLVICGIGAVNAAGYSNEEWKALSQGADFNMIFKVVDDEGMPVQGAKVSGWMFIDNNADHGQHYSSFADKQGYADVKGRCGEWVSAVVQKDGYYTTMLKIKYPNSGIDKRLVDGKWQPYGETRVIVLKKIRAPHVMIMPRKTPQRKMTICDEWLGFDLEKCDFLPPIGEGVVSDALIRFHREDISRTEWSKSIEVSFANYPYAGVYRKKKDSWSDFKSDYLADTNKVYEASIVFNYVKNGRKVEVSRLGEDEYLVYRTRTKVDKEGKLISARYGKLYGPWYFEDAGGVRISCGFLNREDNDINLENTNPDK